MPTHQPDPPESRGMPKLPPDDGAPEQPVMADKGAFHPSRLDDLHRFGPGDHDADAPLPPPKYMESGPAPQVRRPSKYDINKAWALTDQELFDLSADDLLCLALEVNLQTFIYRDPRVSRWHKFLLARLIKACERRMLRNDAPLSAARNDPARTTI